MEAIIWKDETVTYKNEDNKVVTVPLTDYNYYLKLEHYAKDIALGLNVTKAKKLMKKLVLNREDNKHLSY